MSKRGPGIYQPHFQIGWDRPYIWRTPWWIESWWDRRRRKNWKQNGGLSDTATILSSAPSPLLYFPWKRKSSSASIFPSAGHPPASGLSTISHPIASGRFKFLTARIVFWRRSEDCLACEQFARPSTIVNSGNWSKPQFFKK